MCHADVPEGTQAPPVATREVAIPCQDGRQMPGFLAAPDRTPAPAVLVVSDALGRSGFYEHLSCLLADEGFVACAPDYFHRQSPLADEEAETRRARRRTESDEQLVLGDLVDALEWLRVQPEVGGQAVGVIGFCMGGTLSLDLAALWPPLAASVTYYGYPSGEPGKALVSPPRPIDVADQMHGPLLAYWGDQDPAFDAGLLADFGQRLQAAGVNHEFHVYQGIGHGFLREFLEHESSPGYSVAMGSWRQTLELFHRHLDRAAVVEGTHGG